MINPALFTPEAYGLTPGNKAPSANIRRNFILVRHNILLHICFIFSPKIEAFIPF